MPRLVSESPPFHLLKGTSLSTKNTFPRLAGALLGSALLMGVAACASGGGGDDGSSATTFKIGLITELSGTFASEAEGVPEVAQAWADWVNDTKDGINGYKVEIIVKDTTSQPGVAASVTRELVERDKVAAVAVESGLAQPAVWDYLDSQNVPLLGTNNGTVSAETPSTFFSVDIGFPNLAQAGAVTAKNAGDESIASAVCSEVAACKGIGSLLGEYAPTVGVSYEGGVAIAATATNATAQCLEIVNSGAQVVASFLIVVPAQHLIDSCKEQGFTGRFLQVSVSKSNFDALGTDPMLGVSYDFPWWSDAEPVVEFRDVMDEYGVEYYQSFQNTNLWATLQLLDLAMEAEGPAAGDAIVGQDVIDALRAGVKEETLDGLLPQPITFDEGGNTTVTCFWPIERDANGEFKTLAGEGASGNGVTGDLASDCT
jgi:branched-chain amino acid transport system substrate-binding protein